MANKINFSLFRKVLSQVRPYRGTFIFVIVLAVLLAPISILRPKMLQHLVDTYIVAADIDGMTMFVVLILGVLLLEVLCRYLMLYYVSWIGQSVIRDMRVTVFNHILRLRLPYFDKTPIGQSTTRTISDIEAINTIFSEGSVTIIAEITVLIAVFITMLLTSWKLTFVVLTVFPFLIWATNWFRKSVRDAYQIVRTQISVMNSFLQEHISGMRIVQIFNAENREADKFRTINRAYTAANLNSITYYAIFFPIVDIISAISLGLMVWYGARGLLDDSISIGTLVSFPMYIAMLYRPVRMLADRFNTLQMGLIAAERVYGLIEDNDSIDSRGNAAPTSLEGHVAFKDVKFSYDGVTPVLKGISFDLEAGKTLAIVGSTGSGKTTIINLLNRFYELDAGSIEVDGKDIRDYNVYALRNRVAVVLQDVFLFSGTVLENITLKDASISRAEAIAAAKLIGAHEFIAKLPGGYDYQVMERGATLSMGQRQLISFVRALVFNPDILILDEATSSIDPESESIIQHAIEKLIAKRTSIIIAHRLSTIRHANLILALDKGEVAELGSQDDLLAKEGGVYRKLYDTQFLEVAS